MAELEAANVFEPVPQDETPIDEPILDEPIVENEDAPLEPVQRVHPLKPGGVRFEQVYKQAKDAQRELVEERERRIVAETLVNEYKTRSTQPATETQKEYSWAELEPMIATGQITRADAEAHREAVLKRKVAAELKAELTHESTTASRTTVLSQNISAYVSALPVLTDRASAERQKVDQEFDWLVSVQGLDPAKIDATTRKALELTALRNAFGSIETLTNRSTDPRVQTAQGLPGGQRKDRSFNPDQVLLDKLTVREVDHYKRMIKNGRYKGWKDVVDELKYVPGQKPVQKAVAQK